MNWNLYVKAIIVEQTKSCFTAEFVLYMLH